MLDVSAEWIHLPRMDTHTFTIDPGLLSWFNENSNGISLEAMGNILLEAHLVDAGAPVPKRYGVGREDFLHAVDNALDDLTPLPLEHYIESRRLRVARAVANAFAGK